MSESVVDGIAAEFLHNANRGRRLVAVDGAEAGRAARFADALAQAIAAASGDDVVRRSLGAVTEAELRSGTVEPFRAGEPVGTATPPGPDAVLVVDGQGLLDDAVRGIWHFSAWTLAGDELPHTGANVIVDLSDEGAPSRYFYDYCAIPPSVNRPGLH
ncbi:hypothetical protein [Agromyces soli]|uniref:Uncharacterized protein n=1 Tax=Agromyces soli TaxID=659012 RepID=A0ABY4B040_9MICO|nr:hypothetical protein [Agromyces soli]UOE27381.1 hypothetical protein MTP13_06255 [Agromyces soli]